MSGTSAVTLSNENGPSRSQPCQKPRPATSDVQRPAYAPGWPYSPNATHQLGAERPSWAQ